MMSGYIQAKISVVSGDFVESPPPVCAGIFALHLYVFLS